MLHVLPLDILRLIVDKLDSVSLIRLESVCKDVRDLRTPCPRVTLTEKRLDNGMQDWLDRNAWRVRDVVCLKTGFVAVPYGVRRACIIDTTALPCFLDALPSSLRSLAIRLGQKVTDDERDLVLGRLSNLRTLKLVFGSKNRVRIAPPASVRVLSISGSRSLTVVRFPAALQKVRLKTETVFCAHRPLPVMCASFMCRCETIAGEDRLFAFKTYSKMKCIEIYTHSTPSLMPILSKMPRLRSLRCTANVILVGDELATSSSLRSVKLHARYCFAVGFVSRASVERIQKIKTIVASASEEPFEFIEFYQALLVN